MGKHSTPLFMSEPQNALAADSTDDAYENLEREYSQLEDRFSRLIALLEREGVEFSDEMRHLVEGELDDLEEEDPDEYVEDFLEKAQNVLSPARQFSLAQRIIAETSARFLECLPSDGHSNAEAYDSSYVDLVITVGANLARLDSAALALAEVQLIEIIDGDDADEDEA